MSLINDALIDLDRRRSDSLDLELGHDAHEEGGARNISYLVRRAALVALFLFFIGFILFSFSKRNFQGVDADVEKAEIKVDQSVSSRDQRVVEQATIALKDLQISLESDIDHDFSSALRGAVIEINKPEVEITADVNGTAPINEHKQDKKILSKVDEVKSNKTIEIVAAKEVVLAIEKSGEQKQLDRIAQVERLLAQNNKSEALRLMQDGVDSRDSPFWLDRLIKYYLVEKQYLQAKHLIQDKGDGQGRHSHAYIQSLRATEGETATIEFIRSLESPDEKSLATLAGLLQKQGHYRESSDIYQKLLRENDRNGVYWLGLAVALDKLDDSLAAISAYKNALQFGQHKAPVVNFAHARIKSLARRNGALESQQW